DVSFSVQSGKTIALVGPSGGGKTTMCHLIPRFYEVNSGVISIDGIYITKMTRYGLRKNIGIVQQDVFLFGGSIKDNIAYGNLDASFEEIVEAAKRANIHNFIMDLPEGYDTEVGERGVKLSGGQKQRISIARAFLKNPPILILDEATSALDNVTEMQIQQSLSELSKGRTTIVVAHRLSTIKNADEIMVITKDGIAERGNHDQLMQQPNGIYAELYNNQFKTM
ncbi:MAG: ATP-binding cassette domain-containing protein, partial [Clostridia bacterium]|nr:ATP-binding cassette domain-containing protein [Clostridia bacterium]